MNFENPSAERVLYQLKHNLRSLSDIRPDVMEMRQATSKGIESLLPILNAGLKKMGRSTLTSDSLEGATLYPDTITFATYKSRHTLPPVGIGIAIPADVWATLTPKLQISESPKGFFLNPLFLEGTPLAKTGLGLHISGEGIEFELLYQDIGVYSRHFLRAAGFNPNILKEPFFVVQYVTYQAYRDFCAYRADNPDESSLTNYVLHRVNVHLDTVLQHISQFNPPGNMLQMCYDMYSSTLKATRDKIPQAAHALALLRRDLYPSFITPMLFSLGSTYDLRGIYTIISPFEDLVAIPNFFSDKQLKLQQVTDILRQKEYLKF